MTGTDRSLRSQLERGLNNSQWLQKFKAINQLLHSLKREIADINHCELRWNTGCNGLDIHCPSIEICQQLQQQRDRIISIAHYADRIVLMQPNSSDIILKAP